MSILTSNQLPDRIWKALQDKFAHENTTKFHDQFAQLFNNRIDSNTDIADKVAEFEILWIRL